MNAVKLAAIAMIVGGCLALVYGSFGFTTQTHEASVGPLTMSVQEKKTVNVPVWAGVAAIVAGAGLLVFGKRG